MRAGKTLDGLPRTFVHGAVLAPVELPLQGNSHMSRSLAKIHLENMALAAVKDVDVNGGGGFNAGAARSNYGASDLWGILQGLSSHCTDSLIGQLKADSKPYQCVDK